MPQLLEYFSSPLTEKALHRYDDMLGEKWPLNHKVEMYQHAEIAFGNAGSNAGSRDDRLAAFDFIYSNLRAYWQVFRSSASKLSCPELFGRLETVGQQFCRGSRCALPNDLLDGQSESLLQMLENLRDLKQLRSGAYSEMAVSKFLHFFNPRLFPIYDTEFVWKRTFKAFRTEYWRFWNARGEYDKVSGPQFYRRYVLWAGHLFQNAPVDFMQRFVKWYVSNLEKPTECSFAVSRVPGYFATAFEAVAVGAAQVELDP